MKICNNKNFVTCTITNSNACCFDCLNLKNCDAFCGRIRDGLAAEDFKKCENLSEEN
jgi:hypothetical protein